jgi:hypothetical protein
MKKRLTNQQQILADEVGASGGTFLMPGGKGSSRFFENMLGLKVNNHFLII